MKRLELSRSRSTNKLRVVLVVLAATIIAVSTLFGASWWSAHTAHVLLRFAEDDPSMLQGGTLLLTLFNLFTLIVLIRRRMRDRVARRAA
jgi:hypothetical protein